MKRAFHSIYILPLVIGCCVLCLATKPANKGKTPSLQEVKGNNVVTDAIINGGPMVFKTYEEFLNGTGKAWTYLDDDVSASKGKLTKYTLTFKDESGKKVKIASTDLWGWRNEYGEIYRMGNFVHDGITKVAFELVYIANDHCYYFPKSFGFMTIEPSQWCSENINSVIVGKDDFFKNHSKDCYDRIRLAEKDYEKKFPLTQKYAFDVKALSARNVQVSEYRLKSSDLICVYTTTSWNKWHTAGFGSYFFNKKTSARK